MKHIREGYKILPFFCLTSININIIINIMTSKEIKNIRKSLGLTQEQFAYKLKVSKSSVYFWERGSFSPSPLALEKLKRLQKRIK